MQSPSIRGPCMTWWMLVRSTWWSVALPPDPPIHTPMAELLKVAPLAPPPISPSVNTVFLPSRDTQNDDTPMQRTRVFFTVTFAAVTVNDPEMSSPLTTAPAVETV